MPYDEGMTKLIYSGVLPHELGYSMSLMEDPKAFQKAASAIGDVNYADLAPDKDHVGIHLIALGEVERYGFNRNGDGFPKVACIAYHDTFVKNGHVYRHHNNKDPEKRLGDIKMSAYTEPMGRIELFIHAHKEKAAPELEKLEKTGEVPFSMACVLDPEYPVLTAEGYKRIVDIQRGDTVYTKNGSWRTVTEINRRRYTGKAVRLSMNGLPLPLSLTADHLMWSKTFTCARSNVKTTARRYFNNPDIFEETPPDWNHAEHFQSGDRLFYRPVSGYPWASAVDDVGLAKVMGYFIAEGSFNYNGTTPCTSEFTCNAGDSAVRELPAIINTVWPSVTVNLRPKKNSSAAVSLTLHSTEISKFLYSFLGKGCAGKIVPPEIFNASRTIKLAFIGAWLEGDGWADGKGAHWSTSSSNLALQLRDLLATLEIPSSIYMIDHAGCETSGYIGSGVEYTINVSPVDAWVLAVWSPKVKERHSKPKARSKPASMRPCFGDLYAYRIKEVDVYDVVDQETYNFEVSEDDPTYLLAGLISHNCRVSYDRCSICNNVRKSSKDPAMCDHVRDELGKVAEDGQVTGTYNDEPNFFDISFVYRPADRIAWHLKVASAGTEDSVTLATESGLWTPESLAVVSKTAKAKLGLLHKIASMERHLFGLSQKQPHQMSDRDRELWELRKAAAVTQTLDDSTIDKLRAYDIDDVLYHMAADGIVLDPPSFFKYATGSEYKHIADYVSRVNEVLNAGFFSQLEKSGSVVDVCNDGFFDINVDPFRELAHQSPRKLIAGTRGESSFIDKYASHRTVVATIERRPAEIVQNEEFWTEKQASGVVKDLAERYASYKLAAVLALQALNPEQDLERQLASVTAQHLIKR